MLTELQNFSLLTSGDKVGFFVTVVVLLAILGYAIYQYPKDEKSTLSRYRALGGEFVGTFLLALTALGGGSGIISGSFAAGITIAVIVYLFAAVSSAHFNPAVSIAAFIAKHISARRMLSYIFVQLIGARLAVWVLEVTNQYSLVRPLTPTVTANLVAEFVGTMILLFVVATVVIRRESLTFAAPLFGLTVAIAPVITGTDAFINPAIATAVSAGWVTVLMPILGGLVGLMVALALTIDRKQLSQGV